MNKLLFCLAFLCISAYSADKSNWEGAWKIGNPPTNWCFPMSNIQINRDGSKFTLQGTFDKTQACIDADLAEVIFTSSVTNSNLNPDTLEFSINANDKDLRASLGKTNGQVMLTMIIVTKVNGPPGTTGGSSSKSGISISRVGDAVPVQAFAWAGSWDVPSSDDCCYPVSPLVIAKDSATNTYSIPDLKFQSSAACKTRNLAGAAKSKVALKAGDDWSVASFTITIGDAYVPGQLKYQGGSIANYFYSGTNGLKCHDKFTNKAYKQPQGFPGNYGTNSGPGSSKDSDDNSGANPVAVIVIILAILAMIGAAVYFYMWRKRQAERLNKSLLPAGGYVKA